MKPSVPKGTRDFLPEQVIKRQYIFDTIQTVFEHYGYGPIETPVMENLSTLTGKYGEEGDRLLFKLLNNGDFLKKADHQALDNRDSNKVLSSISKRGLRYDLTVPFARFVVMHRNDIQFPFKRYQIQPVWRADRPQKGRYQEFYQCDVDVVGSNSLMYEAELIQIYEAVFQKLNLDVTIRVNNRKILAGMAELVGMADRMTPLTITIDKLDKIGEEGVRKALGEMNMSINNINLLMQLIHIQTLEEMKNAMAKSEIGLKGVQELETTFEYFGSSSKTVVFDATLARGLNYYTGFIVEVVSNEEQIGSIGGGGRYDNLTEIFGLKDVSGVGISFGAARIYDIMETLDRFPNNLSLNVPVIFLPMDDEAHKYSFGIVTKMRSANLACDIYPEPAKFKKQIKYAQQRKIEHVIIVGSDEMENDILTVKHMPTGEQYKRSKEDILKGNYKKP